MFSGGGGGIAGNIGKLIGIGGGASAAASMVLPLLLDRRRRYWGLGTASAAGAGGAGLGASAAEGWWRWAARIGCWSWWRWAGASMAGAAVSMGSDIWRSVLGMVWHRRACWRYPLGWARRRSAGGKGAR